MHFLFTLLIDKEKRGVYYIISQTAGRGSSSQSTRGGSQGLVPRGSRSVAMRQEGGMLIPEG